MTKRKFRLLTGNGHPGSRFYRTLERSNSAQVSRSGEGRRATSEVFLKLAALKGELRWVDSVPTRSPDLKVDPNDLLSGVDLVLCSTH